MTGCTTSLDSGGGGGTPDSNPNSGGAIDAAVGSTTDAGSASSLYPCKNKITSGNTNGHHNPGQDCLNGCHNHGFTLAGTLYDATGTTALSGGSITVTDANGTTFDMIAQTNGNFYTSKAITFPVSVYASECPTSTPMTATVTAANGGGCNQSGCHTTGAQGRIHL
ncbi:MAG: hypothetical protein QM831_11170 [Kofleriaceae bacterium]